MASRESRTRKASTPIVWRMPNAKAKALDERAARAGKTRSELLNQIFDLGWAVLDERHIDVHHLLSRLTENMDEFSEALEVTSDRVGAAREELSRGQDAVVKHLVEMLMILRVMAHRADPRMLQEAQENARGALNQAHQTRVRKDTAESVSLGG